MHFNKGELPPANGFWSLTMYDKDYFSCRTRSTVTASAPQNLKANADGSVDLYIQNENPAPTRNRTGSQLRRTKFILMMRLYWPKEKDPSILDGSWKIPRVRAVE